jgi:DNA (cytosine-5)-methyltransferase 1
VVAWGEYEPAIRRWEHVLGHPAPPPAEAGPGGRTRLSAVFAEWLMGIPHLVTGVPGIPRTAQLRIIGNGVVPHQAAAALRLLAEIAAVPGAPPASVTGMRAVA